MYPAGCRMPHRRSRAVSVPQRPARSAAGGKVSARSGRDQRPARPNCQKHQLRVRRASL